MIKFKIHSVVDVITNSSTVIYTYQNNSIEPAKELINEMLKLSGIKNKKADDIFYFGVFCEKSRYIDYIEDNIVEIGGFTKMPYWGDQEFYVVRKNNEDKLNALILSIMKGEREKPEWMANIEEGGSEWWAPTSYLYLEPKDIKYKEFGDKISALLNSISADGGRDG